MEDESESEGEDLSKTEFANQILSFTSKLMRMKTKGFQDNLERQIKQLELQDPSFHVN
jgi:hypothetical protein